MRRLADLLKRSAVSWVARSMMLTMRSYHVFLFIVSLIAIRTLLQLQHDPCCWIISGSWPSMSPQHQEPCLNCNQTLVAKAFSSRGRVCRHCNQTLLAIAIRTLLQFHPDLCWKKHLLSWIWDWEAVVVTDLCRRQPQARQPWAPPTSAAYCIGRRARWSSTPPRPSTSYSPSSPLPPPLSPSSLLYRSPKPHAGNCPPLPWSVYNWPLVSLEEIVTRAMLQKLSNSGLPRAVR